MYKLTLTHEERQAIDWIGSRYRHGDELYGLLNSEYVRKSTVRFEFNCSWSDDIDIVFNIPEHISWQIKDIIQENDCDLTCFGSDLSRKLISFSDNIV